MSILPVKGSKGWFMLMVGYGVVLTLVLWLNRFVVHGSDFEGKYAFRFLMLAFIIAIVVNGLGWLGARIIWLATTIGTVGGVGLMFYYTTSGVTGWEDLASFLSLIQGVILGFGIGIVLEALYYMLRLRR